MNESTQEPAGCDSEAARLLPWFVTGQANADEAARVEAHVATCPVCRTELEEQRRLREWLRLEDRIEYSPQPSLQKLMTRIDELDRELPECSRVAPATPGAGVATRATIPQRWLVAALVVQTAGLALVCSMLWGRSATGIGDTAKFQTLTSTVATPTAAQPQLRVVFAPGTTIDAAGDLLQQLDANIVSGPSSAGAYALALERGEAQAATVEARLARLRADRRIVFAEPIMDERHPSR